MKDAASGNMHDKQRENPTYISPLMSDKAEVNDDGKRLNQRKKPGKLLLFRI